MGQSERVERISQAILASCRRIHAESENTIVDAETSAIENLAKALLNPEEAPQ